MIHHDMATSLPRCATKTNLGGLTPWWPEGVGQGLHECREFPRPCDADLGSSAYTLFSPTDQAAER